MTQHSYVKHTRTEYLTVKLTLRQARHLAALLKASIDGEGVDMTRVERGSLSAVEKKVSTLVYQKDVDRSIRTAKIKAMMAEHNL